MLRLAGPVLAEELLNLLVGYTDWWLTGHFLEGAEYKAAMGLMAYLLWLIPSLFAAIAIGATALVARFVGAGDSANARKVANQAVLLGAVFGAVATVGVWFGGPTLLRWLQLPAESQPLAWRYLSLIVPAIPAIMFEQIAIGLLRGAGDTVTGLVAKIAVNAVNIGLSAALVVGWGPFPELGWPGLAIGSAIGHFVGALILAAALIRGRSGLVWEPTSVRPDYSLLARMLKVGLPGGLDVLSVLACHLTYVSIINTLGAEAAGAHGLGVELEALAYAPASSFAVAAATMAGQYLGAGEAQRAVRAVRSAVAFGVVFMTCMGVLFHHFGWVLVDIFIAPGAEETARLTTSYLRIVSMSLPFLAVTMVFMGTLRGAGDTLWSLAITLIGLALIRVPCAAWLAWPSVTIPVLGLTIEGWDLGVTGAWYAMVVDVFLRSMMLTGRFLHGGWKRVKV